MKNFTLFIKKQHSLFFKKILLLYSLSIGLTNTTWSQASLNPALPANLTICTGLNASFTVSATATGTITYQWQESIDGGFTWNNLIENGTTGANPATGIYTGTTSKTLTITHAPSTMNGNKYQNIVSVNGINSVLSNPATLNVGPDVSLDNVASANCPGTSNTLNTAGVAGVNYQWQVSTNAGSSWANVLDGADPSGVTYTGGATAALVISPLNTSIDGYLYRYLANDGLGCGTITSGITTQNVPTLAVFTLPAAGTVTAALGASISFSATITAGTGPFTYQWQVASGVGAFSTISTSNASYTGANTGTLTIPSVATATYTNKYRLIMKTPGGCTTASSSFVQVGISITLPLKLESFSAEKISDMAEGLSWTVDAQNFAQSYIVQRSTDGLSFTDLGVVNGEAGKTTYNFLDNQPGGPVTQYRIKTTDQDGGVEYSIIITVTDNKVGNRIELRPSITADGFTNLYTGLTHNEVIALTVTDVTGRPLWAQSVTVGRGEAYTPLNVSRLSKGLYYVHITSKDGISTTLTFVKN